MQPLSVVEADSIDDLVLGLAAGFEAQAMGALDLKRAEQGLGHGVVPAIAFAAHGPAHAEAAQDRPEVAAGAYREP